MKNSDIFIFSKEFIDGAKNIKEENYSDIEKDLQKISKNTIEFVEREFKEKNRK